jgi:hypothetical protein
MRFEDLTEGVGGSTRGANSVRAMLGGLSVLDSMGIFDFGQFA